MVFENNQTGMLFGIQITIVGLAFLQIVALEDAFFNLFLFGVACIVGGTALTVAEVVRS
ncbi:hypothetical protein RBH26_00945 [Natronolimnohabitans sp. A-GB9]|uniref:hypothetical protein n=1 Tax=Natronolimnohabitans sp. A-GB9 TaxID=3069757 RepID=UPI0027B86947|nr:hypothetical protein [Natronolimnohabitans sp. A-GB9]MDQ2049043.1 hypothetical protein [Natronolimnohabitans sp. A-GB9]